MTTADAADSLRRLGWPQAIPADSAVRAFQRSFRLAVDGIVGPVTTAALRTALARLAAGKPTLSAHFDLREFACRCGGKYAARGCAGILVVPQLVVGLEAMRTVLRAPLVLEGAYRCREHNRDEGGVDDSQHVLGAAADLIPRLAFGVVKGLRQFSGIGLTQAGLARHVDVRHVSGHNPARAKGSLDAPAWWKYAA